MFQGFYTLTSGVLTQTRNMNVISNNMSNTQTAGYKSDKAVLSDFGRVLMTKTEMMGAPNTSVIGSKSNITTVAECVTNHSQGSLRQTGRELDFALVSDGYFCVQTEQGTVYTRNGNFSIDEQGFLCLPSIGRVLGTNGPINIQTDRIVSDSQGRLYNEDTNEYINTLMVVDFENPETDLTKTDNGVFLANANGVIVEPQIEWKTLENSNADPMEQMTQMISGQRALQSSAQVMKIYDKLIEQMVSKLGAN